jgi:hypothetical protein
MRRLLLIIFILLWVFAAVVAGQKLTSKINDALQLKSSVVFSTTLH